MKNIIYLPHFALSSEFEEFRKCKTTEEKEAFKKKLKAEYGNKSPEEQKDYDEKCELRLIQIRDRLEELIEMVKRENEAKMMAMA